MTTLAPDRTSEQRQNALDRANEVRQLRAQFKRDLHSGDVSLIETLLDPPEWLLSAKAFEMMCCAPMLGRVRVGTVFNHAAISPVKTFAGLTARQRRVLVDILVSRGHR